MNIFYLADSPIVAAQSQCDKHVVKMILESAQMLSTAHRMLDGIEQRLPSKSGKRMVKAYVHPDSHLDEVLYKAVHHNHPSTVWTREAHDNYMWHYEHFVALCDEYTYRYGKVHMTDTKLRDILATPPSKIAAGKTTIRLAMNNEPQCIVDGDPVQSYRNYYQTKQDRFSMAWSKRSVPEWFKYEAAS